MKKVLLVIVDALTSHVVQAELKKGSLPTLQSLIDTGDWRTQSTAIFPSLTLAATPSITTGHYPNHHGMVGAYWYHRIENRIIYFGGDAWIVLRQGFGTFLDDFLIKMNHKWLAADTIFELVERSGKQAGSLNWFFYRGLEEHTIDLKLLNLVPNAPAYARIFGPSTLHLGNFANKTATLENLDGQVVGHPFNRFGFTDYVTGMLLLRLAEERAFPDFTLAYFPDNDFRSHDVGPDQAADVLHKVDGYLKDMIDAYGGLDQFLAEVTIIISGDHSQSDIVDDDVQARIDLEEVLSDCHISKINQGWGDDDQLIVCPNGRAATIYFRQPTRQNIKVVTQKLLDDPRVDQVICRGENEGFEVHTKDWGDLYFMAVVENAMASDHYQRGWKWSGDLTALGETDIQGNVIEFEDYPNAFERIATLLSSERSGEIWVTALTGYDFVIPGVKTHPGGGSHGTLHVLDSSSPLIIAGNPAHIGLPEHPRSVDLVPLCLELLGIPNSRLVVGKSHVDVG